MVLKHIFLCPTDQIYHKFVHDVIRHQELVNFQIQDLCDFIMTSQFYKEKIDWEEILRRVRKNDIESLFKFHCWQIKRNLGAELPQPINNLSNDSIKYYEKWYDQLSECPEWLESASERLMAILVRGGNVFAHLKNSFNVLVKESALNESSELLLSLYHIKEGKCLLPFIRTIHLFRILFLHILIITYLAKTTLEYTQLKLSDTERYVRAGSCILSGCVTYEEIHIHQSDDEKRQPRRMATITVEN